MNRLVFLSLLVSTGVAQAQPLATAIQTRYPTHELVPRSCVREEHDVAERAGRVCLFDGTSDRVRAVRRLSLGGDLAIARRGDEVLFVASGDPGGVHTRYDGRVWRWDLARDAYLGVARTDPEVYAAILAHTHEGLLYATRAGLQLSDGSTARQVSTPWEIETLRWGVRIWSRGGKTWALDRTEEGRVVLSQLELRGSRFVPTEVASFAGQVLASSDARVVGLAQIRGGLFRAFVVDLPAATVVPVDLPRGIRRPRSATFLPDGRVFLEAPGGREVMLTLGSAPSATIVTETPDAPALAMASSLHVVDGMRGGKILVASSNQRFALGPDGVTRARRATPSRSSCRCDGEAMVCRDGTRVENACPDVQELEVLRDEGGERVSATTTFTPDGRFRIDRLEPDHARITRLLDGARLWVRIVDDALLAQTDDGHYFTTDRAIEAHFFVREGRDLRSAPVVPLASVATRFDAELVSRFFATE
ncbi:MAG: hypothetical protein H6721_11440 [Sandaracinus sp.]|nr:hypothetical protein [Sandaracinus sp.]